MSKISRQNFTFNFQIKLVVIGVHSSKFANEKSKSNVVNAARRHLIKHPIVCDFDMKLWSSMDIVCWPTLLVVDPDGLVVAEFRGELQSNLIRKFLKHAFKFYAESLQNYESNQIDFGKLSLTSEFDQIESKSLDDGLNFPTKMCLDPGSKTLFISDSGNNRIIGVDTETNVIKLQIGSGQRGFSDGSFQSASFDWPQGLAFDENKLYVTDTFNDLIRVVDLERKEVLTLCGISNKLVENIGEYDYKGGRKGLEQSISSPWDVCMFSRDTDKLKGLLIACAGTHQIWFYALSSLSSPATLWKNVKVEPDTLLCIAGNGKERNKNNSYPLQASFAQPSGLSTDDSYANLYIADAESSSIRSINLTDGAVKAVAGGDTLQPDNLFAYGDCDGKWAEARFQHPLDVKCFQNRLVVVDTYNNSLRKVDLSSRTVEKIRFEESAHTELNEPSCICIDKLSGRAWIADSNSHQIRVIHKFDLNSELQRMESFLVKFSPQTRIEQEKLSSDRDGKKRVLVGFKYKLNRNAPNVVKVKLRNNNNNKLKYESSLSEANWVGGESDETSFYKLDQVYIDDLATIESLKLELNLVYCESDKKRKEESVCKMLRKKLEFSRKDLLRLLNASQDSPFYNSILIQI
jgi:DNA-binding beta-propeller fold protein YncE